MCAGEKQIVKLGCKLPRSQSGLALLIALLCMQGLVLQACLDSCEISLEL